MDPPQQIYQSEDRYHELGGEYAVNIVRWIFHYLRN